MIFPPIAIVYSMRYNSPMIIFTSILVFILFSTIKFQNRAVNKISGSVLSVYLISSLPFFGPKYYQMLVEINNFNNVLWAFAKIGCFMIIFYFSCILADYLRKRLTKSLEEVICKVLEYKVTSFLIRFF